MFENWSNDNKEIQDLKLHLKNKQAKQTNKNKTTTVTQTTRKN